GGREMSDESFPADPPGSGPRSLVSVVAAGHPGQPYPAIFLSAAAPPEFPSRLPVGGTRPPDPVPLPPHGDFQPRGGLMPPPVVVRNRRWHLPAEPGRGRPRPAKALPVAVS